MIADYQLAAVMRAALLLPADIRNRLLQVIADRLELPPSPYSESDLDNAVRITVQQLVDEFGRPPGTILWLDWNVRRRKYQSG